MAPKLEQVFTVRAYLNKDVLNLGPVKGGAHRIVVSVTEGFLKGPDIDMKVLPGSGDWILLDPTTGTAYLDVRLQARSADGDLVYAHYTSIVKINEGAQKFFEWSPEARTTELEDQYFFATPTFEASSEKLKWLEQTIFLGHGRFIVPGDGTQAVEYECYKVSSA